MFRLLSLEGQTAQKSADSHLGFLDRFINGE
jgi:ethanolamine utilization microcompartment shell protein EutS